MIAHKLAQALQETFSRHRYRGVPDAQFAHRAIDHILLFITRIVVDDRKSMHVIAERAFGDTDQGIGIDSTAHAERQGNIRAQPQLHRTNQPAAHTRHRILVPDAIVDIQLRHPITLKIFRAICRNMQPVRRPQFSQAIEKRLVPLVKRLVAIYKIAPQVILVHCKTPAKHRRDKFDFGPEIQAGAIPIQIQRLFAKSVAAKRQRTIPFAVDAESPHALATVQ